MEVKTCTECGETKTLSEFYSQKKYSKKRGEWIYHNPECKECTIKRSLKWRDGNYDIWVQREHKYNKSPKGRITKTKASKKFKEEGKYSKWLKENKDKLKEYRKNREEHKTHEITKKEWNACKHYFNNSCAYCGLPMDNHYIIYAGQPKKTDFHKEHVDHDGANDLSNCVPACRDCNSEKWKFELDKWYNENNLKYNKDRFDRIHKWLNNDYLKYIKTK